MRKRVHGAIGLVGRVARHSRRERGWERLLKVKPQANNGIENALRAAAGTVRCGWEAKPKIGHF
eukprot:4663425-Prymnesium_polylepis.1